MSQSPLSAFVVLAVRPLFGPPCGPVLTSERLVRGFNILIASLMPASPYPVFMDA